MWTIGYDQVLDEPPSSPSLLTLAENRSRVPSISQPAAIKLQSNPSQLSVDSDAESDEGEGKPSEPANVPRLSLNNDRPMDEEGESNATKVTLTVPSAPSLNSPTGSDKFIVVTDVEILEAKAGNHSETLVKSTYLDLKEGERRDTLPPCTLDRLLSQGFKWVRRLNYRGKLTMHTAYERKENPSPAAVTAIGISKYVSSVAVHLDHSMDLISLEITKQCLSVMHEAVSSVGLSVTILVEAMLITGSKMKLSVHARTVPFDSHLPNEDIIAGKNVPSKPSIRWTLFSPSNCGQLFCAR